MNGKQESVKVTDIWQKYERSRDYLDGKQLVERTNENWRFYLGDQWYGMDSGGERLPSLNFIKGIVRYKTAVVSQNSMVAAYSPMGKEDGALSVCELLNQHFRKTWEKGKMDTRLWEIIKAAQIQGEAYLYFGSSDMTPQLLPNVNVLFADEQQPDIQAQQYILIYERRFVSEIRREAEKNGVSRDIIDTITPDEETQDILGNITEVRSDEEDGKCVSILYLHKDNAGVVHMARSTRTCVYQPDTIIRGTDAAGKPYGAGLRSYPLVSYFWEKIPNSARGQSEVRNLIANQLELNKTLARRSIAVKLCAFPRIVYDSNAVTNPDALDNVGMKVKVSNIGARNVGDMISYLDPAPISGDARALSEELMNATRELAGAGENATGSVDPTQASGAAIIAVRNQNELPLNENVAAKAQFVEDLALLWFDMWVAYNPGGLEVQVDQEDGGAAAVRIPQDKLQRLKVNVRVDVSQANPFSKLAQEQALERMMQMGQITFEEYIEALPEDSNVPKAKVEDILKKRQEKKENQMTEQLAEALKIIDRQNELLEKMTGQAGEIPLISGLIEERKETADGEMPTMRNGDLY